MRHVFGFLLGIVTPVALNAQELPLATRGVPAAYAIVRPVEASPSQCHAAEELQRFTERMTGVKLPIVTDDAPLPERAVLLGGTRHTAAVLGAAADLSALGEDGFRIVARPPYLLILGNPRRGTLYGVYEVLERFGGCRWHASWHSVVPQRDVFSVPTGLDETQTPAFLLREPFWFDMFDGDLAARNKANGNAMRLAAKHGGHSLRFGGGLGSCHTFDVLLPVAAHFDAHPEYFSEVKGKRIREHTQLCLTNPDVLRIVTSNVLERIRKDPGAAFYGVSQNDWYNPCECPACKAVDDREGSHAGTMIEFVNSIAEAVEKEFPKAVVETLAYQYTRKPPKTVRPRHNVMPCLCTIECDFSMPITESAFEENRKFMDDIKGWAAISPSLYVWDYTTNFRSYQAPFPNILALQGNVKFFRDNHVSYLFEQGAYQGRHGEFAELKAWLLAKWLWNPDLPMELLMKDFLEGYYGAAAPLVRRYLDELHTFHRVAGTPARIFDDDRAPVIPTEFYERAAELWRQAEDAVKDNPAHAYNVRMGAMPARFALLSRSPDATAKLVWLSEHPERGFLPSAQKELAATLLDSFREAKDIRLSEDMNRHDAIKASWERQSGRLAEIEDTLLRLSKRGQWGDTVADAAAGDGTAMKLYNTHYEWCTGFSFRKVAFDEGARYKLRARVRVEKIPGAPDGEAFWLGVYDYANKKGCGGRDIKCSQIGDGYQWFDVAEWVPEEAHDFWIGPGRFDLKTHAASPSYKAVYIDKLELSRVE